MEFGGRKASDFIRVLDKRVAYKRSKVEYRSSGGALEIRVIASDPIALVSSLNAALKQLRIVASVDGAVSRLAAERIRSAKPVIPQLPPRRKVI